MELTSAQLLAVNSIEDNVLVSAGAGSGKTMVLVERIIENLRRTPELKVSNLVAVTFTRKAADEMRLRLKTRIKELAVDPSQGDGARWRTALSEIDSAHIGTIHSLCQSILSSFPVECEVDPQFDTFGEEDLDQEEMLELSVQQGLRELLIEQDPENSPLIDYPLEEIEQWLFNILKAPLQFDEALATHKLDTRADFESALGILLRLVQERLVADLVTTVEWTGVIQLVRESALIDETDKLELLRRETLARLERIDQLLAPTLSEEDPVIQIEAIWSELMDLAGISLKIGKKNDETAGLRAILKGLRELIRTHTKELPSRVNLNDDKDWRLLSALLSLVQRTRAIYAEKKKEAQKLDFNDLIWLTYKALNKPGSKVQQFYRSNLKEILVDEFQDTNRLQARLIACLAGPDTRLFLIGDDKQSIYKFQGADVSTFNEWHEYFTRGESARIQEGIHIAGKRRLLGLQESFRSHSKIVRFINELFGHLMQASNFKARYRSGYRSLSSRSDATEDCAGERIEVVSFAVPDDGQSQRSQIVGQIEPQLVADWIMKKLDEQILVGNKDGSSRPARYGDCAILVQRNKDFALLERGLTARDIPYVTIGGTTLLERQEVFDIENLLQFLADPANDHALIGALRSPMFSVTDDVLHNLTANKGSSLWWELQKQAQKDGHVDQALKRACSMLKRFLTQVPLKSLRELLLTIITKTSYDLVLMSMPDGRQRSRNLWKILDLAARNEHLSCGGFAQRLKAMESFGVKQANAPVETSNAVKLMTIHKAKGLEFPIVLLPVLHAKFNPAPSKLLFHHHYGVAIDSNRNREDAKPLFYRLASLVNEDMEIAEKKRLLYVAATRAKDYLAVFLPDQTRQEQSFANWLVSFLGARLENLGELDPGSHIRQLGTSGTGLLIHRFGEQTGSDRNRFFTQAAGEKALSTIDSAAPGQKLQLDLIEPLEAELREESLSEKRWPRGVRSTSQADLDPIQVGNFFHSLMEFLPKDMSELTDEAISAIASTLDESTVQQHELTKLVREGRRLLDIFYRSELYDILKSAENILRELPYYKFVDDKIEIGRPDLLIKPHQGAWLIVDHKTDTFAPENLEQQAQRHHRQLKSYKDDLFSIAGVSAELAIYFAQTGVLYRFPVAGGGLNSNHEMASHGISDRLR